MTIAMREHIATPVPGDGKPHIVGRSVTVEEIVVLHRDEGKSAPEIANERDLRLADVYAALSYYYDHQCEIDRSIRDEAIFIDELRRNAGRGLLGARPRPTGG